MHNCKATVTNSSVLLAADGSEDAEVERLLQRVSDGVLAEDRREALALLRDLLSDSPKAG